MQKLRANFFLACIFWYINMLHWYQFSEIFWVNLIYSIASQNEQIETSDLFIFFQHLHPNKWFNIYTICCKKFQIIFSTYNSIRVPLLLPKNKNRSIWLYVAIIRDYLSEWINYRYKKLASKRFSRNIFDYSYPVTLRLQWKV